MKVIDKTGEISPAAVQACTVHATDGTVKDSEDVIIHEHLVEISINRVPAMRLSCTPEDLAELITGRLYTEGIIDRISDVEQLCIGETGSEAEVTLKHHLTTVQKRRMKVLKNAVTDYEAVFALTRRFSEDSKLHRLTGGTHSCYLYLPGGSIVSFEDISRHNAMDKAVGYALLNDTDLSECMLYTTGRVPGDMVIKAVMAGVPVLISKSVPTDEAVRLSREYGLTLVYGAWPDSCRTIETAD